MRIISTANQARRVGCYEAVADDFYFPYCVPQNCGNRTDVRWATVRDKSGQGLLFKFSPLMSFSASHYDERDLANAAHTWELERRDEVLLNFDIAMMGLGGGACGPGTRTEYLVTPGRYDFQHSHQPFVMLVRLLSTYCERSYFRLC